MYKILALSLLVGPMAFSDHLKSEGDQNSICMGGLAQSSDDKLLVPFTEEFFEAAKKRVRARLTGQDRAFEQMWAYVKGWYLTKPEERRGPTIILAVGPTATGKTTLAFEILKELDLMAETFYFHVEKYAAQNANSEGFGSDLFRAVETFETVNGMEVVKARALLNPVVFLDEVQKINTVNEKGEIVDRPNANQIYEFLGNKGKLRVRNPMYDQLKYAIRRPSWYVEMPEEMSDEDKKDKTKLKEFNNKTKAELEEVLRKTSPQLDLDFSRGLFIVAMNLDNVYAPIIGANPDSLSADDSHIWTSRVSPTQIRHGLLKMFRAEHVRRLGRRYVRFATFSESEFRLELNKQLDEIKTTGREMHLDLDYEPSFVDRIYNEGVVPSQGMFPLIDTVIDMAMDPVQTIFSKIRGDISEEKRAKVRIEVDPEDPNYARWTASLDGKELTHESFLIPNEHLKSLDLRDEPLRSHVALRLSASVAAGIIAFREFPSRIQANSRIKNLDGMIDFSANSQELHYLQRSTLRKRLVYTLIPFVLEQMIYGEPNTMSFGNIDRATKLASAMAKDYGMTATDLSENTIASSSDRKDLVLDVESLLKDSYSEGKSIIETQREFITGLARELTKSVVVDSEKVKEIFDKTWVGDKAFMYRDPLRTAQDFLKNPAQFQFKNSESSQTPGFVRFGDTNERSE